MFGKSSDTTHSRHDVAVDPRARGGVAFGPILTGVVVAFGAMFLLSALIGGVLVAMGLVDTSISTGDVINAGLGAGIALVVAQFLSYLWGGYTAGRMARGSGLANGLLVPLTAIIVAILVGGIATALGANANLNLPFTTNQLPTENGNLVDWGVGIGIASLVAMFLGGALGGGMGARWHSKLEHAHGTEVEQRTERTDSDRGYEARSDRDAAERREVDLREDERRPVAAGRSHSVDDGVDLSSKNDDAGETRTYRR